MDILQALKDERDRLSRAIAALEDTEGHGRRRVARSVKRTRRRHLSVAARKRISAAAKARWAKVKKAGGNRL